MTDSLGVPIRIPDPITVVGTETMKLDDTSVQSFSLESREAEVVCSTGNRYSADWQGIGIDALCEAASAPERTTHVVIESHDGYRIAVPIVDALNGVLALVKNDRPLGARTPYATRFVAPDVEGARDVKGVSRVEFHVLDPGSDPEHLEQGEPEDDRCEADHDQSAG